MKPGWQPTKWLDKKSQQGFRGYPVGTTAFNVPSGLVASVLFDCYGVLSYLTASPYFCRHRSGKTPRKPNRHAERRKSGPVRSG